MQAPEDYYIKIAGVVGGDDATGVVAALMTLKSATDEQIANHANLRIPSVRRTLYKLLNLGLVRYEEKREPEAQKTYYLWTPAVDQLEGYITNMKRVVSEKIRTKLEYLRSHVFFECGDPAHKKLTFEEAMEAFYKCPVCGKPLQQVDVGELIGRFEKRLSLLEGDVKERVEPTKMQLYPTVEEGRRILSELGASDELIRHSEKVVETTKSLLEKLKAKKIHVNEELLLAGAIFHDVGRTKTHGVEHGFIGATLLREKGYPEELALIAERHVGGGIGKTEAKKILGVERDLSPKTVEEKIVSYADKLVNGSRQVPFSQIVKQYRKKFGPNHLAAKRLLRLQKEVESLLNKKT